MRDDPWDLDGGPAFPVSADGTTYKGMTVRGWFAGQALAGPIPASTYPGTDIARETIEQWAARSAYFIADRMLELREKEPTP